MHEQMVRFATQSIQTGHNPLTGWFPYLGEGSPQFLHYQSLGAMVTGLVGTAVGADTAFRWSMYLLVALWPAVIFTSARLMKLGPWTAAVAAALSPLIMSVPSVGYEHGAYLWIGFGVWAQLWASWTLPLAWACTWRSMDDRRFLVPAAVAIALTIGFHFETGYLAILAVVVFPFIAPTSLARRLPRAAILLGASLLASAWVLVPVVGLGKWAAINEVLRGTPLENGYGAGRILSWLVSGQIYDAGRLPIITLLLGAGIITCVIRWRTDQLGRSLVVMWSLCLLMSFGRTTFGKAVDVIPGASDLFFRRFLMGSQLAGLMLAGIGTVACANLVGIGARRLSRRMYDSEADRKAGTAILLVLAAVLFVVAVVPAVLEVGRFDDRDTAQIANQVAGEAADGPLVAPLIAFIKQHGGGRTYAGLPTNWGMDFTVGEVPVFKYLESRDVDEVGYTLRTASLMTDPESFFVETNPGDYTLFGIRYLILPSSMKPPVPATPVMQRGQYRLWTIGSNGYLSVVQTIGAVRADRSNVATQTNWIQRSRLPADHEDVDVAFAGKSASPPSAGSGTSGSGQPPGTVLDQPTAITDGSAVGTVHLSRPAVVMLSASFDPGWRVTVDGESRPTQMLAPAVVGVAVAAGTHRVAFTYVGFSYYPELIVLALLSILILLVLARFVLRDEGDGGAR